MREGHTSSQSNYIWSQTQKPARRLKQNHESGFQTLPRKEAFNFFLWQNTSDLRKLTGTKQFCFSLNINFFWPFLFRGKKFSVRILTGKVQIVREAKAIEFSKRLAQTKVNGRIHSHESSSVWDSHLCFFPIQVCHLSQKFFAISWNVLIK